MAVQEFLFPTSGVAGCDVVSNSIIDKLVDDIALIHSN